MKTNFIDLLAYAQHNNIDIFNLNIAYETSFFFDKDGEDFEEICHLVKEIYMDTYHVCIETICDALKWAIKNDNLDIYNWDKNYEWKELIELVCSFD